MTAPRERGIIFTQVEALKNSGRHLTVLFMNELELLKIMLLCNGMTVSKEAYEEFTQHGKRPATLAEYATTSGIPLKFKGGIWVNAPFLESFAKRSEIQLHFDGIKYLIRWEGKEYSTEPTRVPAYINQRNRKGIPYKSIGATHTDKIRISPIQGCDFMCKFCDLNTLSYEKKNIEDIIEMIEVAIDDPVLPAKHGLISGGTPKHQDRKWLADVYKKVMQSVDIPMDMMIAPWADLDFIESLYSWGVNALSINMELWDERRATEIMPQKHALGREKYISFIKKAVDVFGKGNVQSLLLFGLEPMNDTLQGIDVLASLGCLPVLSPFRPCPRTPLAHWSPPTVSQCIEVYERSLSITKKYNIKLGPRCISCQHNTLTFPDGDEFYFSY